MMAAAIDPTRNADERSETPSVIVPIEHAGAAEDIAMADSDAPRPVTLMELVDAVGEVAETEQEVLATVSYMLRSGRVRLADDGAIASAS